MVRLGVNIDHVATIREARGTPYPDPVQAALEAIEGGADQITVHLREDRRHIQDEDVWSVASESSVPINLEMAAVPAIIEIACRVKPHTATLVPERREELTTEGGLDVAGSIPSLMKAVQDLTGAGIEVSLFIDPDEQQVEASRELGVRTIELHTGSYCDALDADRAAEELGRLVSASERAHALGLRVAAGHGIHVANARALAKALPLAQEYNIGHAIVARAIFIGMAKAVREMKELLTVPER